MSAKQTKAPEKTGATPEPEVAENEAALAALTLQQLREFAGVSVWTWHPVEDRVYHSAGGAVRSTVAQGLPLGVVLGHIRREDRTRVRRLLRAAVNHGRSGTTRFHTLPRPNGTRVLHATYFPAGPERPVQQLQIIVQDITRIAESERALRESEDHYRTAVALNPEIPWLADPVGNIIEFGPRWTELVGFTAEETLGHGWLNAVHPDDARAVLPVWQHSLATGTPADVEYRIRCRDGSYLWMRARAAARRDSAGLITRWYGTLEDIDERKRVEAALRESEEFSRSILESGIVATEVLDLDGRLIFMNGPGMRMMEVDDFATVRDQPFESVWPATVAPLVRGAVEAALAGKSTRQILFGPTAKGTPRWWELTISPIRSADGRVSRVLALSHDVTDAKVSEAEARAAADRLASVLESTMDNVISVDRKWRITYMNRRAVTAFPGLDGKIGIDVRRLFGREAAPFFRRYALAMATHGNVAFEEYMPSARAWFEVQAFGSDTGLNIFFRNVTERREALERVAHLARHDPLTGLSNRMHFHERLREALVKRSDEPIAVMVIDLDDFKLVNDTLGHPAGDALLAEMATRLSVCAGNKGMAARLGGDEFALMIPVARAEAAASTAQAILSAVLQPYVVGDETVNIGASIGIAMAPRDGRSAEALLQNADTALYRVKAEHGRSYRFFEAVMDLAQRDRREMKRDLTMALQRGEFSVVYQPLVELPGLRISGFEALLRWHHPRLGTVPPALFIPLAEEAGLIGELGGFVLATAAREAAQWPEPMHLAVNLSPTQFHTPGLSRTVEQALARAGLSPRRLEVEITESVLLTDNASALAELSLMHAMGISVALDDFGTGYSSLGYLRRFAFDKLKIDRSFISDLPGSDGSLAIVRSILGLGRSFGTRITAEGVETAAQLDLIVAEGCDEAQGYLFSRPVAAREALAMAMRGRVSPGEITPATTRTGTHS